MIKKLFSTHRGHRRLWLFRLAAVMLGITPFLAAEGVCILFDWGRPTEYEDPFVGFSDIHPLFVPDESGTVYHIPASRQEYFADESFPVQKGEQSFRIFCLGGSTVQGRPFSKATSFTTWLELGLEQADERYSWDVINCGGISYASYRLVPILEECLSYQPDLFIICTGHNEFLEDRTYGHIKRAPGVLSVPQQFLSRFRIYVLLREFLWTFMEREQQNVEEDRPTLPAEVDALLDYKDGIKVYHRDEQWRAGVVEHYEFNLRHMISQAREANVPVILIRPPSNLLDCPPFKSEHRKDLSSDELNQWRQLMEKARSYYQNDLPQATRLLRRAIELDNQYAATYYELGKCLEAQGRYREARKALLQARDLDICPLRILSSMEERLAQVAEDKDIPLMDAHELLEQKCSHGILGGELLVDHVHPSFKGHQMIAEALIEEMIEQGWVEPESNWKSTAEEAYVRHFNSLPDIYFLRGQRNLETVNGWARGRVEGPPIQSRKSIPSDRKEEKDSLKK